MNNKNFKILNNWLKSLKLDEEKEPTPKDAHIDQIAYGHVRRVDKQNREEYFFKSLELFYDLIHLDFGYDIHVKYVPILYMYLRNTCVMTKDVKEKNIWDALDHTSPEILLTPKPYFLCQYAFEGYEKILKQDVFKNFHRDCFVYYCCWMDIEDIKFDTVPQYRISINIYNIKDPIIDPILEETLCNLYNDNSWVKHRQ